MHLSGTQLILPGITRRVHATFANFVIADNAALVQHLQHLSEQPMFSATYLWGQLGAGVSHLLEACCALASDMQQSAMYLPLSQLTSASAALFDGLADRDWVCIDDLSCLEAEPAWQEALFHQFNRMQQQGGRLIVGATCSPKGLAILPDLQSRLASGLVWQVKTLSDADKIAALLQTAQAKHMQLSETVVHYLLQRHSRSMSDLLVALETLDSAALRYKRKLTIPFVKQILVI